jgi:NAD(P)-dependent dehydrogenase (short-subunit alcohol dehydrogenase family)
MKTILVTGGNRGLGRALVLSFHEAGWKVLATARNVASIPTGERIRSFPLDLSKNETVSELVSSLSRESIDCIIHNAGFNPKDQKERDGYFESTFYCSKFSAANVAESMMINALNPMELTGKLIPLMSNDCVVVAISSWLGSIGAKTVPGHYGYCGSKALLNMCIKGLALEFTKAEEGRVAVALNPGWMKVSFLE